MKLKNIPIDRIPGVLEKVEGGIDLATAFTMMRYSYYLEHGRSRLDNSIDIPDIMEATNSYLIFRENGTSHHGEISLMVLAWMVMNKRQPQALWHLYAGHTNGVSWVFPISMKKKMAVTSSSSATVNITGIFPISHIRQLTIAIMKVIPRQVVDAPLDVSAHVHLARTMGCDTHQVNTCTTIMTIPITEAMGPISRLSTWSRSRDGNKKAIAIALLYKAIRSVNKILSRYSYTIFYDHCPSPLYNDIDIHTYT